VLRNERWLGVVQDLFGWHHDAERYLRNEDPLARVGLVYSQRTAWFHVGRKAKATVEDHAQVQTRPATRPISAPPWIVSQPFPVFRTVVSRMTCAPALAWPSTRRRHHITAHFGLASPRQPAILAMWGTVAGADVSLSRGLGRERLPGIGFVPDFRSNLPHSAARQAYQVPETGVRLKPGQKLSNAYLEANLPVARRWLYQAGVRLAWVLNEAFPEKSLVGYEHRGWLAPPP
jgi:hypothetical protein